LRRVDHEALALIDVLGARAASLERGLRVLAATEHRYGVRSPGPVICPA
jgi:hypothetical protein